MTKEHEARQTRRLVSLVVLALGMTAALTISNSCTRGIFSTPCSPGDQQECSCPDDTTGTMLCTSAGMWTNCDCGSATCDGINCSGHGTCSLVDGKAQCDCETGYHAQGLSCVNDTNPCDGVDCSGHGSCSVIGDLAECTCENGYHAVGLECVQDGSPCDGVDCSGHGTCSVVNDQAQCNCDTGYHAEGLQCVADTNPCDGVDCSGHGTCSVVNGSAQCNCDTGYHAEGLTCVIDDPCSGIDCSGHGTCSVVNGSAQCNCDQGYHAEGLACVDDATPCSGQTCSGHGTCMEWDDGPVCACDSGYTPSRPDGLDCVPTTQVCVGGPIDYDVDGDGTNETRFDPNTDECLMYELVNRTRATHDNEGTPESHKPLAWDVLWSAHARNHSYQMQDQGGLFHADFPGGQNCAMGCGPDCEMNMYMNGSGEGHCPPLSHHCNIMRTSFGHIGIGYVGTWNTQNFY